METEGCWWLRLGYGTDRAATTGPDLRSLRLDLGAERPLLAGRVHVDELLLAGGRTATPARHQSILLRPANAFIRATGSRPAFTRKSAMCERRRRPASYSSTASRTRVLMSR